MLAPLHVVCAGATLHEGEAVLAWRPTSDGGVQVETQLGDYTARRLVLTAGAWMPELVPALQVDRVSETAHHLSSHNHFCCEVSACDRVGSSANLRVLDVYSAPSRQIQAIGSTPPSYRDVQARVVGGEGWLWWK